MNAKARKDGHSNAPNRETPSRRRNATTTGHCAQDAQAAPYEEMRNTLSIVIESHQIAFALYNEYQNEILLESVQVLSKEHLEQKVSAFMTLTNPNFLIVSSRLASNVALIDSIRSCSSSYSDGEGSSRQQNRTTGGSYYKIPYQINKSKAYDLNHCKMMILQKLRVLTLFKNWNMSSYSSSSSSHKPSSHDTAPTSSKHTLHRPTSYHSLASIIDFESPTVLKAVGSLLCHLQSTSHRLEEGSTVTINSIRHVHSSAYMKIDPVTLQSLHIFATDHHPLQKRGHDKEGFSLFNLLDRTKSAWGRKCLREWMRNPLLDVEEIRERQDGVQLFLEPNMRDVMNKLVNGLCKIGPMENILSRMGKCSSVPMDFIVLSKTLASFVSIFKTLNLEVQNKIIDNLNSCIDPSQRLSMETTARHYLNFIQKLLTKCHVSAIQDLLERIVSIVDHEATMETKDCVVIHYGFHEELDRAKESFDTLDTTLSMIGSQILHKHPGLFTVKVVFLPQVGFLIALDKRNHHRIPNSNDFPELPPDFSYVFEQDNEVFFKNNDMRRLDDDIGDLDAFIKDTESMIVSELEEDILDCESELRISFGAMAELDCIISFASCAADLNYIRPTVVHNTDAGQIVIENGRHPLQELLLEGNFIPNDTFLDSTNRVSIVTGPNFSGKSCYMRQVGILVYMSHIGSFVPCDTALIPVIDQIVARINNIETCAVPQSSYQLDLTQMATILNRSTRESLVLIDEFGKGTSPLSGISVLTAALKKLSKIQCKVICTTHFLEIFSLGLLKDGDEGVRVLQMAVHVPDSDDNDDAVPLFKLEHGLAKSSAGLVCAKLAGVHVDVLSRANEILGALKNGNQVKPKSSNLNSNSVFQPASKAAIRHFLSIESWKHQPKHEITALQEKIALM